MQLERIRTAVKVCSYSYVRLRRFLRARLRDQFANVLTVYTARVGRLAVCNRRRVLGFGTLGMKCSDSSSLIHTLSLEASS